jgi:hypothetical protein
MRELFQAGTGRRAALIFRRGRLAGLAAGLLSVAAVHQAGISHQVADAAYWDVYGPPCAAASAGELAGLGRPLRQVFDFDLARIERISGSAVCSGVTLGGPFHTVHSDVCQFNTPRAVAVVAAGRKHAYIIEGGHRATVTVWRNGDAKCVLAGHFKGD